MRIVSNLWVCLAVIWLSPSYAEDPFDFATVTGVPYTTTYAYDAGDNLRAMTLPSGRRVTHRRDALGRIEAIETLVDTTPTTLVDAIRYQADGQVVERTLGNGLTDARDYDLQGRLIDQSLAGPLGVVDQRSYGHDPNGNVISRMAPVSTAYDYDRLDRLVEEMLGGGVPVAYDYDGNGNRTRFTQSGTRPPEPVP